jgi:phosphatidylglycerophosphate synthase
MSKKGYICEEHSFTYSFLSRYLFKPIGARLPNKLSPNALTLSGVLGCFLSVLFVWLGVNVSAWFYLLAAAGGLWEFLADNLDGLHARRTGQTSPLGEFLDHWLDTICLSLLTLSLLYFFGADTFWMIFTAIIIGLSSFATFWEQRQRSVFYSAIVGPNEAWLGIAGLYLIAAFLPRAWFVYQPWHMNIAILAIPIEISISAWTIFGSLRRVGKNFGPFLYLGVLYIAISLGMVLEKLPLLAGGALLLFVTVYFSSGQIVERLTETPLRMRHGVSVVVGILGCAAALWIPLEAYQGLVLAASACLALGIVRDFIIGLQTLTRPPQPQGLLVEE